MGLSDPPGRDGEQTLAEGKMRDTEKQERPEGSVNMVDVGEYDCDCSGTERQGRQCSLRDSRSRQG